MTPEIALGVLVEHSLWGQGKVVELLPSSVVVHFPSLTATDRGPRRKLHLNAPQLAISAVQTSAALDRVPLGALKRRIKAPTEMSVAAKAVGSLDTAIVWFRQTYGGLFAGPKLQDAEIAYKRAAHDLFVDMFGDGRGRALLRSGELAEVTDGLDKLYHATNIPSQFEIMAAHDGLKDANAAGQLLEAALDFIDLADSTSFGELANAVASLPAPSKGSRVLTWPNVTILPFLGAPDSFMVLKPEISQRMAARMGFDLLYSPEPTWHCYSALQEMSRVLLERLREFDATDFIDVQSFMWVTRELA